MPWSLASINQCVVDVILGAFVSAIRAQRWLPLAVAATIDRLTHRRAECRVVDVGSQREEAFGCARRTCLAVGRRRSRPARSVHLLRGFPGAGHGKDSHGVARLASLALPSSTDDNPQHKGGNVEKPEATNQRREQRQKEKQ